MRFLLIAVVIMVCLVVLSAFSVKPDINEEDEEETEKIDDWNMDMPVYEDTTMQYSQSMPNIVAIQSGATGAGSMKLSAAPRNLVANESILGFSTGGAKDIDNFRQNIENNYLPQLSSITYEGLFYDYYFDTEGISSETEDLFMPSYNLAKQSNERTGEDELWLSVGLNSNIAASDFSRKKLNLVIVLDISGSMSSPFDSYYYDGGNRIENTDKRSKLEIATETICSMIEHLKPDDRLGVVLFNNQGYLAKPLNLVGKTDMIKIKEHIMELSPNGGTNMYAGMQQGSALYKEHLSSDKEEYENRIIFLTDAMPNRELTDKHSLWGVLEENSKKGLYATLIGVGVDFQTRLVEHISKVEGANYYSIHSAQEFKQRLDDEFEFMVTPLVFNLNLVIDAEGYEIKRVCGTPYSEDSKGEIMKVGTLFPSASEEEEVKGGIILVELKKTAEKGKVSLLAGYDDRSGKHHQNRLKVDISSLENQKRVSSGLRKGVLLVHYADLMKDWIRSVRMPDEVENGGEDDWQYNKTQQRKKQLNEWEQQSVPLSVTSFYREEFQKFQKIMKQAMKELGDENLQQEIELLDKLINYD